MSDNAIFHHAFTLNCQDGQEDTRFRQLYTDLQNDLQKIGCERFIFQLERGEETGRLHYQGYIHLNKKQRSQALRSALQNADRGGLFISASSSAGKDALKNYCMKQDDTFIDGPWTDKSCIKSNTYIPRQYQKLIDPATWFPFQRKIVDSIQNFDDRKVNLIYNPSGGKGKSTIAAICELLYGGIDLPPLNDFEKLMQLMCNICMDTDNRKPKIVFCDLPRAIRKDQLNGMYSAIEQIKKGKLYDTRYHYKSFWIDSPQVWVFTNTEPDIDLLSADRWSIWHITESNDLERWVPHQEFKGAPL